MSSISIHELWAVGLDERGGGGGGGGGGAMGQHQGGEGECLHEGCILAQVNPKPYACVHHTRKGVPNRQWHAAEGTDHYLPKLKISASSHLPNKYVEQGKLTVTKL